MLQERGREGCGPAMDGRLRPTALGTPAGVGEQHLAELDVSEHNPVAVAMGNGARDLTEQQLRLHFGYAAACPHVRVQVTAGKIGEDKTAGVLRRVGVYAAARARKPGVWLRVDDLECGALAAKEGGQLGCRDNLACSRTSTTRVKVGWFGGEGQMGERQ